MPHPTPAAQQQGYQFSEERPQPQPQQPGSNPQQHGKNQQEEFDEKHSAPSLDTFNTLAPRDSSESAKGGLSPSGQRADANRLNDDLELLRAERYISNQEHDAASHGKRIHNGEPEDAFNQPNATDTFRPDGTKKDPDAALLKFWMFLRKFPRFVRYFVYLIPGAAVLLVPVLLGALAFNKSDRAVGGVGGVNIKWFGIWLEIVWGSLWVTRMITSLIPHLFKVTAKLFGSTTPKKWRDVGNELELHTALFLWFLAILISYGPVINGNRVAVPEGQDGSQPWIAIVRKVIIALFVLFTLNFVEKILIQWIATSFHQRTYATRMENNKADIRTIVHLYEHAKAHLEQTDPFWKQGEETISGTQTPMRALQDNARQVLGKVGYVAGRVGNDLIGRKVDNNQPRKVVSELLRTTASAHTLARLIYRSLIKPDRDTVHPEDMRLAFQSDEESEAAFGIFDKDLNGDISLDEFESVTNEIHLEKKAIGASLKDLDSVIKKLDKVFVFIIVIISIVIFISILSGSAAAALGSAGTVVLGLAWVLQATAQEFLQSIIFVFVKHPFDVGDRVTIYGSTGDNMTGDDYYVTEISLLYTEFKKMQGHIVQAPNSSLNTLFILNQRRSNGLADVIPLEMRFGTPQHMIDELKARMLNFCLQNKRDYQSNIISEMTSLNQVRSCNMNIIFFHKSNFQNELLRLNRHNKFVTELMAQMVDIGIQTPFRVEPGGSQEHPMYWANLPPPSYPKEPTVENESSSGPQGYQGPPLSHQPSLHSYRSVQRDQSLANMDQTIGDFQDVFDSRRENVHAHRLASIREKERGLRRESEEEMRASSSGLERVRTADRTRTSQESSRYRVFTRPRSKSKVQNDIV